MWGRTKSSHTDAIRQFQSITNTTEKTASIYLKRSQYRVDEAVDDFYSSGGISDAASSKENEKLFAKYKAIGIEEGGDATEDAIQGDGMMSLVEDLGLDPMDVLVLVMCWKLNVKEQFTITRTEFINGLARAQVDSLKQFKSKLATWKAELDDRDNFKRFHNYVFEYTKAADAKSIPLDIAVPTWKIVLGGRYKHLDDWLHFLETVYKKAISRDTWQQFLEFTYTIDDNFSNYDEDSAWPVVIDGSGTDHACMVVPHLGVSPLEIQRYRSHTVQTIESDKESWRLVQSFNKNRFHFPILTVDPHMDRATDSTVVNSNSSTVKNARDTVHDRPLEPRLTPIIHDRTTTAVPRRDSLTLLVRHTETNTRVQVVMTDDGLLVQRDSRLTHDSPLQVTTAEQPRDILHDVPLRNIFIVSVDPSNNDSTRVSSKGLLPRSRYFSIFYLCGAKCDQYESLSFECKDSNQCSEWVKLLRSHCISWKRRARVLIVINPVSGHQNTKRVFEEQARPIFEIAVGAMPATFCKLDIVETTHAGHARQLAMDLHWRKYNTIAVCGGDGLLHEVVNGLLDRQDWDWVRRKVSLAVIPAGTSSAVAQSLHMQPSTGAMFAAAMIVKGFSQPVDTVSMFQNGQRQFAMATALCGIFANLERWSNRWRRFGNNRYIIGGLKFLLHMNHFQGKLDYVPVEQTDTEQLQWKKENEHLHQWKRFSCNTDSDTGGSPRSSASSSSDTSLSSSSSSSSSSSTSTSASREARPSQSSFIFGKSDLQRPDGLQNGPQCPLLEHYFPEYLTANNSNRNNTVSPVGQTDISTRTDRFLSITATNTNHLDKDWALGKEEHSTLVMCNGLLDLSYIRKGLRRDQLLLSGIKSKLKREWQKESMHVESVLTKVFKITPYGEGPQHGRDYALNFTVDGESIAVDAPLYGEIHESFLRFITVPPGPEQEQDCS